MAPLQTVTPARPALLRWLSLLPALLTMAGGCATVDPSKLPPELPPTGVPAQIVALWNKDVEFLPDRVNNGRLTPALSGRIYLFESAQMGERAVVPGGSLVISLFDDHPRTFPDGTPMPLEVWEITPDCMKQVMAKEPLMGWGYTLNLPWNTYRPDIGPVRFQVRYLPPKDAKDALPLFSDSPTLVLHIPSSNNPGTALVGGRSPQGAQQVQSGYSQWPPQNPSGTLQASYQVNSAGNMVAQPQANGWNPPGTLPMNGVNPPGSMSVQTNNPSGMSQPMGVQPQGSAPMNGNNPQPMGQNYNIVPQGQPQGYNIQPQGQQGNGTSPQVQPPYPANATPQPPTMVTPNFNRMP